MSPAELEALYAQLAPAVFRRARRLLGRDQDAWDAVQEVLVQVLRGGPRFRSEARPMTWVWRLTTSACLSQLRARRAQDAGLEEADEGTNTMAATGPRQKLKAWMDELDERGLALATLLFLDGLSNDETADVLGLPRPTVAGEVAGLREKLLRAQALPSGAGEGRASEHLSPLELEEAAAGLPSVTQQHLGGCEACKAGVQERQAAFDGVRTTAQFKARLESVLQQGAEKPIARVDPETGELTVSKKNPPGEGPAAGGMPTWQWLLPTLALAVTLIAVVYWPQPEARKDSEAPKVATVLRVVSVDGRQLEKANSGELVELAVSAGGFAQGMVLALDAGGRVEVLWPENATLSGRMPQGPGDHLQPAFEARPGALKLFAFFAAGPFDVSAARARVEAAVVQARADGKSPLQAEVPSTSSGSVASVLLQVEP